MNRVDFLFDWVPPLQGGGRVYRNPRAATHRGLEGAGFPVPTQAFSLGYHMAGLRPFQIAGLKVRDVKACNVAGRDVAGRDVAGRDVAGVEFSSGLKARNVIAQAEGLGIVPPAKNAPPCKGLTLSDPHLCSLI